jgi:hypothetical protein
MVGINIINSFSYLFNVVNPETFNEDNNVVLFEKVLNPLTFNDDINVTLLFANIESPDIK